MGNVLTTLFMPVGLGGMGVDFRKDKAPKPTPAPTYDENKEKDKAAESAAESTKQIQQEHLRLVLLAMLQQVKKPY